MKTTKEILNALKESPVTLVLIVVNIVVHFTPFHYILGFDLWNASQNCIQPSTALSSVMMGDLAVNRLILSAFMHVGDVHLAYNMISLGWKGINLEKAQGPQAFLKLVFYAIVATNLLFVVLGCSMNALHIQPTTSHFNTCTLGFSGAIFCLKYVWNSLSPSETTTVAGVKIPSKAAAWAELLLISSLVPSTSVVSHVAGILAGYLYMEYARQYAFMK
eukprot:gene16018-18293_t